MISGDHCNVCGKAAVRTDVHIVSNKTDVANRCLKHAGRDCCAVEGCRRTSKAPRISAATNLWLCGQHFRAVCPPNTKRRAVLNRIHRVARKYGVDQKLYDRWARLAVGLANKARAGTQLDEREINAMFGWGEDDGT